MTRTVAGREWLLGLVPDRDGIALDGAAGSAASTADALARVGGPPVCWAIAIGHDMAARIIREIPAFGGGDTPFEMLRRGTETVPASVERSSYRLLAWCLTSLGYEVVADLPGDDRPELVAAVYEDAFAWLG